MKYCEKCGTRNEDEMRFCQECGKPFGSSADFGKKNSIENIMNVTGAIHNISNKALGNMTGKIKAQAGIILGVAAIVVVFAGLKGNNSMAVHRLLTLSGFVMGIISVVVSSLAKKEARTNKAIQGISTLAFVISIVACSIASLIFLACTACEMCVGV